MTAVSSFWSGHWGNGASLWQGTGWGGPCLYDKSGIRSGSLGAYNLSRAVSGVSGVGADADGETSGRCVRASAAHGWSGGAVTSSRAGRVLYA